MRKLWECKDWSACVPEDCRKGIRLRIDKEVDDEVRRACKEYVNWLRTQYEFPVRLTVYIKASEYVTTSTGQQFSTIFWGPKDKTLEASIKISVWEYSYLLEELGKDDALVSILCTLTHELSHYFQWLKDCDFATRQAERQAIYYGEEIVRDYTKTREHP